jgi:hypothetical protein
MLESSTTVALPRKNGDVEDRGLAAGWSQVPKQTALAQLAKVLDSPHFHSSKKCSLFLRFVVEHAIDNRLECLKERTLGIEVFNRDSQYDTNQDPIVRITAGEVRKRLAQYYLEPGHEDELRIGMPTGSYIPEVTPPADKAEPVIETLAVTRSVPRHRRWWIAATALGLAAVAAVGSLYFRKTDLDRFWAPLITAQGPVLVCLGQPKAYNFTLRTKRALDEWFGNTGEPRDPPAEIAAVPLSAIVPMWDRFTGFGDAQALAHISGLFGANGQRIQVRGGRSISLADLRGKPVVLIGAFDNQWTIGLTGELRFYFDVDHQNHAEVVRDRQHPGNTDWKVVNAWPYWRIPVDYAIISRVLDATTEQMVVVVAGITHYGTQAAGEVLTNPVYFAEVVKRAPRDWSRKNMQIVLSAKVMTGTEGPPQVMAVHFW